MKEYINFPLNRKRFGSATKTTRLMWRKDSKSEIVKSFLSKP